MMFNIPVWIIGIFSGVMFLTLFFFGIYHCWLVYKGTTTNEEIRGKFKKYR